MRGGLGRRYVLSEEKTFASWFHPEKESILRLVGHFVRKEGKVRPRLHHQHLAWLFYLTDHV